MIDERIVGIFRKSIKSSTADQTELVCESETFFLTRFAENRVHQNMGRSDSSIWCRSIIGKKIGVARSNDATEMGVKDLIKTASDIARNCSEDPEFESLVRSEKTPITGSYFDNTPIYASRNAGCQINQIVNNIAMESQSNCAGSYQTSGTTLCAVNSLGTEQYGKTSDYRFSITAVATNGRSGWSQAAGKNIEEFDFSEVASRAFDKATFPGDAIKLDSGAYTVILEPDAVANFLLLLAFLGFGGKTIWQKRSFMTDKVGQPIMGSNVTISEDPFHPRINYMPFDYEGVPRRRVTIVDKGIATDGVYDSYHAMLAGKKSTGNALQPDNNFGPYPKAMVLDGGGSTVDDMIKSTPSGIYITRFWYLNYLNPMKTMVTGYTRDGTFLIEDGKVTKPVVDMRVQQSILEAFSNVEMISGEQRLIPQYGTLMLVPFMKINNLNLSAT